MKLLDNTNTLLGDDLKDTLQPGARLKIAASCFSLYAFAALKSELSKIDSLQFIFTAPTFVAAEVTDRLRKEHREFFIPKLGRETSLYGTPFEIQLRNQLTQRAIARECADWIRQKACFKSNRTSAPMQAFAHVGTDQGDAAYMPLNGFTLTAHGYQRGDAVSNFVNRFHEAAHTNSYLQLVDQVSRDLEPLADVTDAICRHIESVHKENAPERIYFLMLYNIFRKFLDDIDEVQDIDSLFGGGRTTALTTTIQGLDDFELIAFLGFFRDPCG